MATPRAIVRSRARPVKSWKTAKLELMPLPSRRDHPGLLLEDDGEAVGEVQGRALLEEGLDDRPLDLLAGVGDQVLDDRGPPDRLLDREEGLPGLEAVGDRLVPVALLLGPLADDDVGDAVVPHVQGLGRALDAVADDGDDLILQHFAGFCNGELLAGDHCFLHTTEINDCHVYFSFPVCLTFFSPEQH
jgi:hypothetical protein